MGKGHPKWTWNDLDIKSIFNRLNFMGDFRVTTCNHLSSYVTYVFLNFQLLPELRRPGALLPSSPPCRAATCRRDRRCETASRSEGRGTLNPGENGRSTQWLFMNFHLFYWWNDATFDGDFLLDPHIQFWVNKGGGLDQQQMEMTIYKSRWTCHKG